MTEVVGRGATRVGLRLSHRQNRRLLADLLDDHDLVDVTDAVPEGTDLCIVDEGGIGRVGEAIDEWKRAVQPAFAPVLLLAEGGSNPWARYAEEMGARIDAIQPIPAAREAIRSRIDSLLETRLYSRELLAEREFGSRVFETSPIAKAVLDPAGTIVRVNRRLEELIGLPSAELVGQTHLFRDWRVVHEDGEPIPVEELPFERVVASGETVSGAELGIERPDGDRIWLSVTMGPIHDTTGELEYVVAAIEDVTDHKRQQERFRAFVEGSTDIISVIGSDGVIEYVSPSVERVLGYEPAELIGTNVFETVHPADRDGLAEAIEEFAESEFGTTVTRRYRTRRADGTWCWTETRATARADWRDAYVVNTRDVTAQVEAQLELRQAEESRSLALQSAQAGVWERHIGTNQIVWHESTERLYGIEPGSFGGNPEDFAAFVHPEDLPQVKEDFRRAIESGEPLRSTFRIIRGDGSLRWMDARGRIFFDEDGEPERILGVTLDVTEQRDRLQQLKVLDRVLRHNFHNDMNVIRGRAELLQQGGPTEVARHADQIIEHSDRLLGLTEKQRTITRVLSSDTPNQPIGLGSAIDRAVEIVSAAHPEARITVDRPIDAVALATDGLQRAIQELIQNAIVHNDAAAPAVEIDVEVGERVSIRIADDGPPISEEEREVVSGEHEIEPLYHGSGLGLWLVAWIVRRSNGSLEFGENEPTGNVVTIELDAADGRRDSSVPTFGGDGDDA